ncbi:alpha/beta fold hydrolase [Oleomonas cavernae]|uniref:Alpha/beta fold hydrolase n=1 Tax=Oleomonas cavernae TaxID=2320859 RepID=A0A418W9T8_9PROT|nr:alpha/beta fold hydrolase [Oleomonas cavernae]RJF86749.1 alpha/beta fold hydrolase [Oleomonas cavernae]
MLAAIGVQAPFTMIDSAGTALAVSRRGRGQPVLCVHATGHGGRDFEGFAERVVPQGFEVIAVDWPGQGSSPADARAASADRYADLLEALVPQLFPDGRRPILLGCSIGGAAAIVFAARRPDLVQALVLADPGGLAPLDRVARLFVGAMVRFFKAGTRGRWWFPRAFAAYYRTVLPAPAAAGQRARIVAAGPQTAPVLAQAWQSFGEAGADIRGLLPRLPMPVFFAWARQDRIVAWGRSRAAVESVKHAQVQHFTGGHAAFLEDPDAFAGAFVAFARGTEAAAVQPAA